jgi:hypothetical protein
MSKAKPSPRRKLLTQPQRERARGLLDMFYTPAELTEELGLPDRSYIYHTLLKHNLPSIKDEAGHVWIRGTDVLPWYTAYCAKLKHQLGPDQVYCMHCKQARMVKTDTLEIVMFGRVRMQKARCAVCDALTYKTVPWAAPENDPRRQAWQEIKRRKQVSDHDQP